jgi:glycosyltransferase involved in cell wall biosynthesis
MKICLLTYEYPRSTADAIVSGEVKNSYYLARGLVAAGHEITVVSVPFLTRSPRSTALRPGSDPPIYDVPEGRLRAVARYALRSRNVERFMTGHFADRPLDVVHAESPALAAGALGARRRHGLAAATPIVTTGHGTYLPEVTGDRVTRTVREGLREASARLVLRLDRRAFGASDAVIAASRFQKTEMLAMYQVPAGKIEVIHNGVDLGFYRPDGPKSTLAGRRVEPNDRVVLFVGRLVPKKGLQHLIAAFPRILEAIPDAKCVVVGGSRIFDTFGPKLREMADASGLAERFVWLEDVPETEMPALYRRADVAAFPSINYESLPTVTLEAMACGVPVIATNCWGTPEALGEEHPGLVTQGAPAELAHAVVDMLSRAEIAGAVRRDQLERVGAFSLKTAVARHEELYERVAAKR